MGCAFRDVALGIEACGLQVADSLADTVGSFLAATAYEDVVHLILIFNLLRCIDTAGCILVGQNLEVGKVLNSRVWLEKLKQKIEEARNKGEPVRITVM